MELKIILVVDDNWMNLKLIRMVLNAEGYDVRTALDEKEAMQILQTVHPDLILMDVHLAGADGTEVMRRLKTDPATKTIIIVAVTSYAMKGTEEMLKSEGFDGYLSKPIDTRALPGYIRSCLKGEC